MQHPSKQSSPTLRERLLHLVQQKYGHLTPPSQAMPEKRAEARQQASQQQATPEALQRPKPEDLADTIPSLGSSAYADELAGMVNRAFTFSPTYSDQQRRADRTGAREELLEFERKLIKRAFKLGIPLFAHCVVRGATTQDRLYRQGFSKAKAGHSPHNYGCAVDLVHGTKAWALTQKQWLILGHLGHEVARQIGVKIAWGGDWKEPGQLLGWDPAHWELADWRTYRAKHAELVV